MVIGVGRCAILVGRPLAGPSREGSRLFGRPIPVVLGPASRETGPEPGPGAGEVVRDVCERAGEAARGGDIGVARREADAGAGEIERVPPMDRRPIALLGGAARGDSGILSGPGTRFNRSSSWLLSFRLRTPT